MSSYLFLWAMLLLAVSVHLKLFDFVLRNFIPTEIENHSSLSPLLEDLTPDDYPIAAAEALSTNLKKSLVEQHLANKVALEAVVAYLATPNSDQATALILYGGTGTGKTLTAKTIAESLYPEGLYSQCVGYLDFSLPQDLKNVRVYQDYAWRATTMALIQCSGTSLVIFDNLDRVPPDVFYGFEQLLGTRENTRNFTRNIFIFITRSGGQKVNQIYAKEITAGIQRSDLSVSDFRQSNRVVQGVLPILAKHVPEKYIIPFLPMERKHVVACVKNVANQYSFITDMDIQDIANQVSYSKISGDNPNSNSGLLISTSGCARIRTLAKYKVTLLSRNGLKAEAAYGDNAG